MSYTHAERALATELASVRPDLTDRFRAALPAARAAVLARLWRGLVHEPLPWVVRRTTTADGVALMLADGRRLHGPPSDPWAVDTPVAAVELDGTPYDHPAGLLAALALPDSARFTADVGHSVASLALSRTAAPAPDGPPAQPWGWEQRPTDGHPYHPACRSRPGFSAAEQLAYAPEHRPVVGLRLTPVPDARVSGAWPAGLRDGPAVLVPVHPWQAGHVLTGRTWLPGPDAHPLMSLRTLHVDGAGDGGPVHVKTALSTQLTSSVRDISAYSVAHALATSEALERVAGSLGGRLHIARTLAAAGDGSAELAAMLRESPYGYADARAGEQVVPVAALGARLADRSPHERLDRITALARLALGVCLDLLDRGVALEAHGQNLLAVLDADGHPRRLVYRDLADIRLSPALLTRHGFPAPPLTGRLLEDDPARLRRQSLGCLVGSALGPLAGDAGTLGRVLDAATRDLPAGPAVRALRSRPLPAKALTLRRLAPGGDQWTNLPNPLAG
ncbi:IucA/IucC family siderophore biosynthesis protein [Streptomyces bambusae]|uniref:IucA/IucC family siderophore biosynthesis protein n=1 Tax=Streptomyces bambusae TaxID=1550616 RepID=UPI001D001201|nr:IucA/IucC family siderophore biosynthesis protein [Streptomyces bambusae]MCB5169491.1 IucA/IucC family siderophore biosynthesis protein [Streptomyces bambusae]